MAKHLREALASVSSLLKPTEALGIQWIGLREVREKTTICHTRDAKPYINDVQDSHGVMVEVLANGQFGYAATSRRDGTSLKHAVERAHLQAVQASRWAVHRFTPEQRPATSAHYASHVQFPLSDFSAGTLNEFLISICLKLQRPKIVRTEAFIQAIETDVHFVSSNGSDAHQNFSYLTEDFEATASDGQLVQSRTDGGLRGRSYQGGWELIRDPALWDRIERVSEQAVELLTAENCPSETLPLILLPDQMMLQIHESIGHPLELDRILGDERNYAGWSFVKLEDFGKLQYGSALMNVTFDPTIKQEYSSYAWDDTGNSATREHLIENGILKRPLGGMESQLRAGLPGVANARASSWNRAPIDRMANINLEPGTSSLNEMISSVERGIIMESNRSWSIDDFRNKFQFGCEYARLIENGKVTRTLKNPNYRGVTVPFWNSLRKVGSAETLGTYGTPHCGKGEPNQAIRVGHASPACLFDSIEVFGGGAV